MNQQLNTVAAEKRQRILDAARAVCERDGLEHARMSDIARLARVSKGTLYRFFENKDALLVAMVLETRDALARGLEEAARSERSPRDKLAATIDVMLAQLGATSQRIESNFQALAITGGDPNSRQALCAAIASLQAMRRSPVVRVLRELAAAGGLRPGIDETTAAAVLLSTCEGLAQARCFGETDGAVSPARRALEMVLELLVVD